LLQMEASAPYLSSTSTVDAFPMNAARKIGVRPCESYGDIFKYSRRSKSGV
jgi:hypothetical protein